MSLPALMASAHNSRAGTRASARAWAARVGRASQQARERRAAGLPWLAGHIGAVELEQVEGAPVRVFLQSEVRLTYPCLAVQFVQRVLQSKKYYTNERMRR